MKKRLIVAFVLILVVLSLVVSAQVESGTVVDDEDCGFFCKAVKFFTGEKAIAGEAVTYKINNVPSKLASKLNIETDIDGVIYHVADDNVNLLFTDDFEVHGPGEDVYSGPNKGKIMNKLRSEYLNFIFPTEQNFNGFANKPDTIDWITSSAGDLKLNANNGEITWTEESDGRTVFTLQQNKVVEGKTVQDDTQSGTYYALGDRLLYSQTVAQDEAETGAIKVYDTSGNPHDFFVEDDKVDLASASGLQASALEGDFKLNGFQALRFYSSADAAKQGGEPDAFIAVKGDPATGNGQILYSEEGNVQDKDTLTTIQEGKAVQQEVTTSSFGITHTTISEPGKDIKGNAILVPVVEKEVDKTEDGIIKSRLIDLRTGRVTGQEHKDADTGEIIWSVNVVDDKGNVEIVTKEKGKDTFNLNNDAGRNLLIDHLKGQDAGEHQKLQQEKWEKANKYNDAKKDAEIKKRLADDTPAALLVSSARTNADNAQKEAERLNGIAARAEARKVELGNKFGDALFDAESKKILAEEAQKKYEKMTEAGATETTAEKQLALAEARAKESDAKAANKATEEALTESNNADTAAVEAKTTAQKAEEKATKLVEDYYAAEITAASTPEAIAANEAKTAEERAKTDAEKAEDEVNKAETCPTPPNGCIVEAVLNAAKETQESRTKSTLTEDIGGVYAALGSIRSYSSLYNTLAGEEVDLLGADRAFAPLMGEQFFSSLICEAGYPLPDIESEGTAFINTISGSKQAAARIEAERTEKKQPILCRANPDTEAEEQFICSKGQVCVDDLYCYLDANNDKEPDAEEPLKGHFYKITWGVSAPRDETATPLVDENGVAVSFNIYLDETEDGIVTPNSKIFQYKRKTASGTTETDGPIELTNGATDKNVIIKYSNKDLKEACIGWDKAPVSFPSGGEVFSKGLGGDPLPDVCRPIFTSEKGQVNWERADRETPATSTSSTSGEVELNEDW